MQDSEKREAAIKALKFGNLISLKMEVEGKTIPVYLSADPEYKTLNVYDESMQPLRNERMFANGDIQRNISTDFSSLAPHAEQSQDNNAKLKR